MTVCVLVTTCGYVLVYVYLVAWNWWINSVGIASFGGKQLVLCYVLLVGCAYRCTEVLSRGCVCVRGGGVQLCMSACVYMAW